MLTYIFIAIIFIVIGFFIYQGFCTRCPNCGYWGLNRKVKDDISSNEFYELLRSASEGLKDNPETEWYSKMASNKGFSNKTLTCKKCKHTFSRNLAMLWLKTSKKIGEEEALKEYHNLRK